MGTVTPDHLYLIGISHKTAPVELRERFSFDCGPGSESTPLEKLHALPGVSECVMLSTCNRTEIYAVMADDDIETSRGLDRLLLEMGGGDASFKPYFYRKRGLEVIEHLFCVTAGIDSMILGEPQIFGQVKNAYSTAVDHACTGPTTNRLFHHAFQVGKRVRNATSIGEGVISAGSAAVVLARQVLGDLTGRTALLVGAGKIGELCARQLRDSGVGRLLIANRTFSRAEGLADLLGGEAVPFDTIGELVRTVDIIITSVAAPEPLFTTAMLDGHLDARTGSTLAIIDLGVPRNVSPDLTKHDAVRVFNIDDLEAVTTDNHEKRRGEAVKAQRIIAREVEGFHAWLDERKAIPVINTLRNQCEALRREELDKVRNRVSPETIELLDMVTRRVVRKILHNPTITVRSTESSEQRKRLTEAIHDLFIKKHDS